MWLAASCFIADRFGSRSPSISISLARFFFFVFFLLAIEFPFTSFGRTRNHQCLWVCVQWREFIRRCSDFWHILPLYDSFFLFYLFVPFVFCPPSIESLECLNVQRHSCCAEKPAQQRIEFGLQSGNDSITMPKLTENPKSLSDKFLKDLELSVLASQITWELFRSIYYISQVPSN